MTITETQAGVIEFTVHELGLIRGALLRAADDKDRSAKLRAGHKSAQMFRESAERSRRLAARVGYCVPMDAEHDWTAVLSGAQPPVTDREGLS